MPNPSSSRPLNPSAMALARDGLLCGVYPRRLSIICSGRTINSSLWRGDRSTLLTMAQRLALAPSGSSVVAHVVVYVWDDPSRPGKRSSRLQELPLDALAQSLLDEEARRSLARAQRPAGVLWRS